jgi:hypothetical protein
VFKTFKACINVEGINAHRGDRDAIDVVYEQLQQDRAQADITAIIRELQGVVYKAIEARPNSASAPNHRAPPARVSADPVRADLQMPTRVVYAGRPFGATRVIMTARRALQIAIVGIMVFAAAFVGWGLWHFNRYQALLEDLAARGVQTEGVIVDKSRSYPSGSSSASPSFVIEVEHRFEGRPYINPYAVSRSQYEGWLVGDGVDVTLLADDPGTAQLTDVVNGDATHRGFIPLDR